MNLARSVFEIKNGQRRLKPQMVMLFSIAAFLVFVVVAMSLFQRQSRPPQQIESPFTNRPARPQQKLDYNIVKLDTFALGDYLKPSETVSSQPAEPAAPRRESSTGSARRQPASGSAPVVSAPPSFSGSGTGVVDRNPNMIVFSSMGSSQVSAGGAFGFQSTLLKVILPDRTSITNNSLVEARVINEGQWGSLVIPRRSQLIGTATLQNSRVQIDFRELRINNVSHACSGRAYDLKKIPGLPYTPLDAATRKVVLDELRSAAAAIPILGRYANQTEVNPFNDEVARLDEGLEFYVQITNVF